MSQCKLFKTEISLILLVAFFSAIHAHAQDIKTRMKSRLPVIKALKAKGIVGENNKGYLAFVGDAKEKEDVINDENGDRGKVYAAIAAQQGTSVDVVGMLRAKQIADKAEPGEWLQDESGKWYRK